MTRCQPIRCIVLAECLAISWVVMTEILTVRVAARGGVLVGISGAHGGSRRERYVPIVR